jgi:ATP-dependent helicase Lhr and Lhr-like helicase
MGFDLLHPSLQHHVVNSLGWRDLRPLQEQAVRPILEGKNCLLLAPTAGGKTEAAVLPILSCMLTEDWRGLSVIYVCPIRALLNNLEERLSYYCGLVGRRCGLWHGDVAQATKSKLLADPPDLLLTTPESLEALLISRRTDKRYFFGTLKVAVVDEVHAFAGDDRGWHLLCLLERIGRLAGTNCQRIGLSATVGNPDALLGWLATASQREATVVSPQPAEAPGEQADVTIDYVGDLSNAAQVLKLLYRGEKRLVFCDSRARCEDLAGLLRGHGLRVFVSHSSLSVEQRRDAESAFREGRDCVIVATSTLELGIDVGDLDRVIQIDSTFTVSSFLQRLGRTGRRAGSRRNFLFLTTSHETLLQAAAVVELWNQGFVEPLVPPPLPLHVAAQQVMALTIQEKGITRPDIPKWIGSALTAMGIVEADLNQLLDHMLHSGILAQDAGVLGIGSSGEKLFGARNFVGLLAVFDAPMLMNVFWGPRDLGAVHPISLQHRDDEPIVLSLGGRAWHVTHVDQQGKLVHVVPADVGGRSRWLGESAPLSFELCQMVRRILLGDGEPAHWSKRSREAISMLRDDCPWVSRDGLVVLEREQGRGSDWWTFGGLLVNNTLASLVGHSAISFDNFRIRLPVESVGRIESELDTAADSWQLPLDVQRLRFKFSVALPGTVLDTMSFQRSVNTECARRLLRGRIRFR